MGSRLLAICNNKPIENLNQELAESFLQKLNAFNFNRAINYDGTVDMRDWIYEFNLDENEENTLSIDFWGGYPYFPAIYKRIFEIGTIYHFDILYLNYQLDWFHNFRQELFGIAKLLGSTEAIYLADEGEVLGSIFQGLVIEGVPYEEVKNVLISQLGDPVKDFSKLNYETLGEKPINDFFLDEFVDLKGS